MNKTRLLAGLLVALLLADRCYTAEIPSVTVSAASSEFASVANSTPELCRASNVVSGNGLYGDIHTYLRGGTMWLTASNLVNASGTNAFVTFDLGAVHTLDAMKVWNYNGHASASPTSATATNLGVKLANISYSTDGLTFTTNLANQVFNMAPATYSAFAQTIAMGGISARYVRIDVITNWATVNAQVGLSKVRFIDDSVPLTIISATENYSSNQVTVTFSEPVDPATATNMANYSIQSGAGPAVILSAGIGEFNDRVILQATALTNQNYSLIASGVYDEAQTAAVPNNSTVSVMPELIVWLKADAGVDTDGSGNVTQWNDQSSYGHNALDNLAVNQYSAPPTLAAGAVNGLPALSFNGTQLLNIPNDPALAINGDVTICLVLEKAVTGTCDPISKTGGQGVPYTGTPLHGYTNNLPAPFDYQISSAQKSVWVWGNGSGGAPTTLTSSGALVINQYYIVTMVVHGTNSSWYLNGSFNGSANLPQAPVDGGNPIMLGVRADSGNVADAGATFTGNLAEVMILRGTVTPSDLVGINGYLGAKYNIPVATLGITEQPQSTTAQIGKTATFWVNAVGVPPLTYQWKTNGVNIAGATSSVYTTPLLTPADNGLNYTVTVTTPVGSTNSTAATLSVVNDLTAPTVYSATKTAGLTNVVVKFSEPVDPTTGLNAANYSINNGVSVISANYGSSASNSIVLATSLLDTNQSYYLTVKSVQDLFGNTMTNVTASIFPASLAIYLRGDSGVVLDNSGLVDQWLDQTTNGNSAVQFGGGPGARPALDSINGVPVISFNSAAGNYLQAASSPTLAVTGNMSIYALADVSDYAAAREILGKTAGAQPAPYDYYVQGGTALRFYRGNGSVNAVTTASAVPAAGSPHVISVTMQGTNVSHFLDGNPNGTAGLSTTIADGGTPLVIGSRNDLSQFMNGDLTEIMIFNAALSPVDRTNVDNYLGTKYYPFTISQSPQDVTTNQGTTATFTVVANQGSTHFNYQWQENSTNIPGATGASYTTPILAPTDSGEIFDVLISVPGLATNVSSSATLTVNNVPPTVAVIGEPVWSQTNIVVIFSEAVTPATATIAANYSLDNGATVLSAAMGDTPNEVILTTAVLTPGTVYTVTVQNVNDQFGNTISTASIPAGIYPASVALWVKADAGVVADASGVSQWNDLSGNGNNFLQSFGPPFEPQIIANAINGLPAIRFNAADETFMSANSSPTLAITGDMTILAVANFATLTGNTNGMIVSKTSANLPAPYDYYVRPGQVQFYRGNGTVNGLVNSTAVPSVGVPHLLDVTMRGNTVTHRLDGRANGSGNLATTIGDNGNSLYIGTREDGTSRLNGDLAELIIIGASISTNDLAALENYLGTKYQLQIGPVSAPISITNLGNNQLQLNWTGGTLQAAATVAGPYVDISSAVAPYTVLTTNAQQFYRVREN
ncbi:MAG TPA: LamG-like jellyroll fold domain-containing protein [Verrucomicrobiae bacterium]|jgi:hypothetical protein